MREQQHVADGSRVGQQHHEAVHPNAQTPGRRHPVFQRTDEVFVHFMRLVIALFALQQLCFETLALVDRIVQLRKGIRMLPRDDKQFEAVRKARILCVLLGQRRNLHRMPVHKGRLNERFLDELLEERVQDMTKRHMRLHRNLMFLSQTMRFFVAHLDAEIDAGYFFHRIDHRNATPLRSQVNLMPLVIHHLGAQHFLSDVRNHIFRQSHNIFIVGISLV
ncbi:hypothetical protein D3C76_1187050 [compost metagenome]